MTLKSAIGVAIKNTARRKETLNVSNMTIEQDIFNAYRLINTDKLIEYGFDNFNNIYTYEVDFLNDDFVAKIIIDENPLPRNGAEGSLNLRRLHFHFQSLFPLLLSPARRVLSGWPCGCCGFPPASAFQFLRPAP